MSESPTEVAYDGLRGSFLRAVMDNYREQMVWQLEAELFTGRRPDKNRRGWTWGPLFPRVAHMEHLWRHRWAPFREARFRVREAWRVLRHGEDESEWDD